MGESDQTDPDVDTGVKTGDASGDIETTVSIGEDVNMANAAEKASKEMKEEMRKESEEEIEESIEDWSYLYAENREEKREVRVKKGGKQKVRKDVKKSRQEHKKTELQEIKKYIMPGHRKEELSPFSEWLLALSGKDDPVDEERIDHSVTLRDTGISETLADILYQQGHKKKAIEMYQQVGLINPEKSAYFAALIEKLKKQ